MSSSPVNRKQSAVTGAGDWIPLNRWAKDDLSIVTTANGTVTYDIEFTIDQVNRPNVLGNEDARPVANGTGLTADANLNVTETPMEAIRVNITAGAGSVDFHVMQSGY